MKTLAIISVIAAATFPGMALAYVGPGAGLSMLSALWALLIGILTIAAFGILWPLRRVMKRKRARAQASQPEPGSARDHTH